MNASPENNVEKNILKEKYHKEIKLTLKEKFAYPNVMLVPKLVKIVLTMGAAKTFSNHKDSVGQLQHELMQITGQKPVVTKAKKAIANFKSRIGVPVGLTVTLRGSRMYQFAYKLLNIDLARIRDFRGIKRGCDGYGNLSFGLKEQTCFSEINLDKMTYSQGMHVTFVTSARTDEECIALLTELGMPFQKDGV